MDKENHILSAGKYLCTECGSVVKRAFYMSNDFKVGALLVRDEEGRYYLESCVPGSRNPKDVNGSDGKPIVEYELKTSAEQLENGLPNKIRVLEKVSGLDCHLERACPECKNTVTFLPSYCGTIPTYVVAVVGGRKSGKTTWLNAIIMSDNIARLNRHSFPGNYKILSTDLNTEHVRDQVTGLTELGGTVSLYLSDEKSVYAMVILRDFAGELFTDVGKTGATTPLWDTMLHSADAFLFVIDESSEEGREGANETYRALADVLMGRSIPVGVILSHADTLMEQEVADAPDELPLMTENTFRPDCDGSYNMENFIPRLELEDAIARKRSQIAGLLRASKMSQRTFIVKSGKPVVKPEDGQTYNDHKDGINVYDPLLWILNRLRIFPLGQEDL